MTSPRITALIKELDLFWGHEQDMNVGKSRREQLDDLWTEIEAESAGVVTRRLRLQKYLLSVDVETACEALALLYLGRGDAQNWGDAITLARATGKDALTSKGLESPRCSAYIREGITKDLGRECGNS